VRMLRREKSLRSFGTGYDLVAERTAAERAGTPESPNRASQRRLLKSQSSDLAGSQRKLVRGQSNLVTGRMFSPENRAATAAEMAQHPHAPPSLSFAADSTRRLSFAQPPHAPSDEMEHIRHRSNSKAFAHDMAHIARVASREDQMIFEVSVTDRKTMSLNYESFKRMVEKRLHYRADADLLQQCHEQHMREYFLNLDADGDGHVDAPEFFCFAIREAIFRAALIAGGNSDAKVEAHARGAALHGLAALVHLDPHRVEHHHHHHHQHMDEHSLDGSPRQHERVGRLGFYRAATNLGFGSVQEMLFDHLLSTHAGRPDEKIDLNQLLTVINERTQNVKPLIVSWAKAAVEDAKRRSLHHNSAYSSSQRLPLLPMLAQQASTDSSVDHDTVERELAKLANMEHEAHYTHHDDSLAALDHANAVLDDTASNLKHHLRAFLGEVTDVERLFRTFDKSQDMLISESELRKGLEALGFHAPKEAAGALFDELDSDANNKLSFSEFSAWIHEDSVRRRSTS